MDKQRTTAGKASTSSAVEWFHSTLTGIMGRVVDERQCDWDVMLPYIIIHLLNIVIVQ